MNYNHFIPVCEISMEKSDKTTMLVKIVVKGCALKCRHCTHEGTCEEDAGCHLYSAEELYDSVKWCAPGFKAEEVRILFDGGEPLLYSKEIHVFAEYAHAENWKVGIKTSLAVDIEHMCDLYGDVDEWIIDVKSLDKVFYQGYTGTKIDDMYMNLQVLAEAGDRSHVKVCVPKVKTTDYGLIQKKTLTRLYQMGFRNVVPYGEISLDYE